MHEVTSDLYLADINQVGHPPLHEEYEIDAVLRLSYSDPPGGYPGHVDVYSCPMHDGPRNDSETMVAAVSTAVEILSDGLTLVVHCRTGESRSVAVCMAAIAVVREEDFSGGWELVESVKPVRAHPDVMGNARRAYHELAENGP